MGITVTKARSGFHCNGNVYGSASDVSPTMQGCLMPNHPPVCSFESTLGCFNDTGLPVPSGAPCGSFLPQYQPQVHDRVTLEACAAACWLANLTAAGIDAGNHCFCGDTSAA